MTNNMKAQSFVMNAYQMYTGNPSKYAENPFPMYSYEKPAYYFWTGFVEKLLDEGASPKQIEALLRHKHMRWMFDQKSEEVEDMGKAFAKGFMDIIRKEQIGE